jgi:hypothetical protein
VDTSRPKRVLRQIVEIKPGERRLARLIFACFFLIAAPYTMVNALRTSNFLFKEGVGWLPVVYLLAVAATGLIVILHTKIRVRRSLRSLIVPSLVFFAISGGVLQWLLRTEAGLRSAALNYVYWVWASVLITILITGFWMTVNEIYDPRQAKRLMAFLNSGGLSVNHPFREIMYIPIPARLRHKAKALIEMFVGQFAKVAGAVVLLAFALVMNKQVDVLTPRFDPQLARYLSWVLIAFPLAWIWIGLKVGREYLAVLKENIQPLWEPAELGLAGKVDVEYAKLVFDTVDSRNYSSVLYALHLFDLLARNRLTPDLKKVIAAKAEGIRARALSDRLETGTEALIPSAFDELPADDMRTEIPIILSLEAYQSVMGSYAEKLLERGPEAEVEKMELAKAIGLMSPSSALAGFLPRLIGDASAGVSSLALKSAARLGIEGCIPAIMGKLGDPVTLEDAVEALRVCGDKAVGPLERRLLDRSAPFSERSAAVEALGRIGSRKAVRSLSEELEYGAGELDKTIIEALDRLRAERGTIPMSTAAARRKTYALIERFCRDFIGLQESGPGPEDTERRAELLKDLEATFGSIFKLLGLFYPQEDIRRAYQNIAGGTRRSVAHAVEWLDNALDKDLHDLVLPIVDDLDPKEKTARLRKVLEVLAARPS